MNMFSKTMPPPDRLESQKEVFGVGGGFFNVQSNRLTNDKETKLKIKGAFKIRIQNKGETGVKVFGNFYLPSHSDETFETGDTNLGFSEDAHIEFDDHDPNDNVDIVLTNYYKTL